MNISWPGAAVACAGILLVTWYGWGANAPLLWLATAAIAVLLTAAMIWRLR